MMGAPADNYNSSDQRTPRQPSRTSQVPFNRPGSPLKQEVLASPDPQSPSPNDPGSPILRREKRASRTFDSQARWSYIESEVGADFDEVSIISALSEEKDYYGMLADVEDMEELPPIVDDSRTTSHVGSVISEGSLVEREEEVNLTPKEGSIDQFSEIDDNETGFPEGDETLQFLPSQGPPPFIQDPPTEPLPDNQKYVYYPLPVPKQLMLPPRLTGPNASKELPPAATFRPPPVKKLHAMDALDELLDNHETALHEDPEVVLQQEFDSNTLLGTLMNNLRETKTEQKSRARTNNQYVPGGKSLLDMDREAVQRLNMNKALSSRGGRAWGSTTYGTGSAGSHHRSANGGARNDNDELFESVSLAGDIEYREQDENVPLAFVKNRIVTQRQDAEESLVDRMKRLKEEKRLREEKEEQDTETLGERLARLKMEQTETLAERRARLKGQKGSD